MTEDHGADLGQQVQLPVVVLPDEEKVEVGVEADAKTEFIFPNFKFKYVKKSDI